MMVLEQRRDRLLTAQGLVRRQLEAHGVANLAAVAPQFVIRPQVSTGGSTKRIPSALQLINWT